MLDTKPLDGIHSVTIFHLPSYLKSRFLLFVIKGGLAQPFGRDDIEVYGLSAEHTKIRAKLPAGATEQERPPVPLKRGDKILLVPGYGDSMGFMHQQIYAVRNGIVEDVWPIVAANQIQ